MKAFGRDGCVSQVKDASEAPSCNDNTLELRRALAIPITIIIVIPSSGCLQANVEPEWDVAANEAGKGSGLEVCGLIQPTDSSIGGVVGCQASVCNVNVYIRMQEEPFPRKQQKDKQFVYRCY